MSSSSIVIGCNEYYNMVTFNNIYLAFKNAYKNNHGRPSSERFRLNLGKNLHKIFEDLSLGKFKHGEYKTFIVKDPKPRVIKALPFYDRVIQHVLYDFIYPKIDRTFIFHSFANRKGKGTHKGVKIEQDFLRKCGKGSWILKGDIHHFFDSIDQNILMEILNKKIKDRRILWLCSQFIKKDDGNRIGIPIGNVTSQLFANVYLNEMDHFIKDRLRVKYYIRYMDDFVINTKTKEEAISILRKIKEFLQEKLHLKLNGKTQIFPEYKGVNFLGAMIHYDHTKIRHKTVRKIKRKINKSKREIRNLKQNGKLLNENLYVLKYYLSNLAVNFMSWYGLAKHYNCKTIKNKLVSVLQEMGIHDPTNIKNKKIIKDLLINDYAKENYDKSLNKIHKELNIKTNFLMQIADHDEVMKPTYEMISNYYYQNYNKYNENYSYILKLKSEERNIINMNILSHEYNFNNNKI